MSGELAHLSARRGSPPIGISSLDADDHPYTVVASPLAPTSLTLSTLHSPVMRPPARGSPPQLCGGFRHAIPIRPSRPWPPSLTAAPSGGAIASRVGVGGGAPISDGAGRVGTGDGEADQWAGPRRSGADRSREAGHALRVDACGPAGYRSVDRGHRRAPVDADTPIEEVAHRRSPVHPEAVMRKRDRLGRCSGYPRLLTTPQTVHSSTTESPPATTPALTRMRSTHTRP